jgi:IS4 transposase
MFKMALTILSPTLFDSGTFWVLNRAEQDLMQLNHWVTWRVMMLEFAPEPSGETGWSSHRCSSLPRWIGDAGLVVFEKEIS